MTRFSERAGYRELRTAIQVDSIDTALRNALWSAYADAFVATEYAMSTTSGANAPYYREIWLEFYKAPIDDMPWGTKEFSAAVRTWFFQAKWFEVYDFVEFVARMRREGDDAFVAEVNRVLAREVAAYRLVERLLIRITEPSELAAIQDSLNHTASEPLRGAHEHRQTALAMLSDRRAPDYRNSIKESISAVESIAKVVAEDRSADLSKALKVVERRTPIHGALRAGFLSLYGFTSDEGGIRHALVDAPSVDFVDAKYMLVTCSAFVSFLVSRATEAGIALT